MTLVVPDVLEESCVTRQALERLGLVLRRVLKEEPPQHVEYDLTPLGRTLEEPLAAICGWALAQADA